MSTTALTSPVSQAVDDLRTALDVLSGAEVWRMTEPELLATRTKLEAQTARLTATAWALTREIDERGAAVSAGATSTTAWLVNRLHQAPRDAARELRYATTITQAALPATHTALASGAITAVAATVIAETDRVLARYATGQERTDAEASLVGHATSLTVPQLRAAALRVQVHLDPDQGTRLDRDEQRQYTGRHLRIRRHGDGSATLTGYLDKEAAATLTTALDPLARPRPGRDSQGHPIPDPRDPGRRTADALLDLVGLALRAEAMPVHAGQPVQLVVTIGLDQLQQAAGCGVLDTGDPVSVSAARRLACDASVIPAVLGAEGQVLELGRAARTVSPQQRRALAIRDRGCAFPGCDRPVTWTHAHHIQHWSAGGHTDLDNLVLLSALTTTEPSTTTGGSWASTPTGSLPSGHRPGSTPINDPAANSRLRS